LWVHRHAQRREDRDADGLWPHHDADHRAVARLRGGRDRIKPFARYAQDCRALSVGTEAANSFAEWLLDGFDGQARHIVLAHLSQRANNPYLAKITAESALRERAPLFPGETEVTLSFPKEPTAWIEV